LRSMYGGLVIIACVALALLALALTLAFNR
jgi:hypothetical protein